MKKDNSAFRTKFISEAGSFLSNADYFAFVELQEYACYCIADGIDDDKKRNSAEIAVAAVIEAFYEKHSLSKGAMRHYANVAHKQLLKEAKDVRLEASLLIVVTNYKKMRWVNVGNARLYHIRNNRIVNQSRDQSLSQNLAEDGEIQLDMIAEHEERHNLYCYLGMPGGFHPYVSPKIRLDDGDILLMCTRGIWENIGVAEILDSVEEATEPEQVCFNLEDIILSQRLKWISNYTVSCIYVDKVYKNPKRAKIMKRVAMICIPIVSMLLIIGIAFTIRNVKKEKKINQMWNQISEGYIDIDENGKILEDTNALRQGAKSYEEFKSSSNRNNRKVCAAKSYIEAYHLLQEIQEMEQEKELSYMELFKEYARLLGIAKGEKYIDEKLETNDAMTEDYEVSVSDSVDEKYLSEDAKSSFEIIISKYEKNFDYVMRNAIIENIYSKTDSQFETVVDGDLSKYIATAKKNALYNFQNDDVLSGNILFLTNQLQKYGKTKKIDPQLETKVYQLLDKLSAFKNRIVGDAWVDKANKAKKKGKNAAAVNALEKAKNAYKNAGDLGTEKASECDQSLESLNSQIEKNKEEQTEHGAMELFEQGESLFESEYYAKALEKYKAAKKKYMKLKNTSSVDDCKEAIEKCKKIISAEDYKDKANEAKKNEKYSSAKSYYELAKQSYFDAGLNDKVTEMQNKIDKMEEKIEKEANKKTST